MHFTKKVVETSFWDDGRGCGKSVHGLKTYFLALFPCLKIQDLFIFSQKKVVGEERSYLVS